MKTENKNNKGISRRQFLGTTALTTVGLTIIPRHVMGGTGHLAPSDLPNIAGIGFGNQGGADIRNIASMDIPTTQTVRIPYGLNNGYAGIKSQKGSGSPSVRQDGDAAKTHKYANIYALCDIDPENYGAYMFKGYPKAKKYTDFRELIDKEKDLDGVLIATPDHTHAVIAAYAMAAGKAVFVEKPMAKTIYEVRKLASLAKKFNVVTQMGNQGHNVEGTYKTTEWIQSGKIGFVRNVNLWTDRPVWPQGYLKRPVGIGVPKNLNYDLWLGPAPEKPYHPDILHFNWRGLRDYGTGAMGDMGAHIFDAPIMALNLGLPTEIQATSTTLSEDYLPQARV
jgi:hypothetical protein